MSIDWEYRAKQELWTIHESACLLAGVDPRQDKAGAKAQVLHAHAGSPQGMLYRELKDAVVAGSIAFAPMGEWIGNHRIRPMDAVKWAINRGHTVPQDLQRLAIVQTQERLDISTRERDTLLKLIICMAIKGYEYEPGRRKAL